MRKYVLILAIMASVNANADECPEGIVRCGTTDDGLSWEISNIKDEKGNKSQQLTITGKGAMKDYDRHGDGQAPWKDTSLNITNIAIGDGITSIGSHAFEDMYSVKRVSLPEGLTRIETEAFLSCNFSQIDLPSSLETLASYAFYGVPLSSIDLPEGLETIGWLSLGYNPKLLNVTIPENTVVNGRAFEDEGRNVYIQNVYCLDDNTSCQALKNRGSMAGKVHFYQKDSNGYFYNNRWYASPNDISTANHIKKRIYTIDEANKVVGKVNSVKIRYR